MNAPCKGCSERFLGCHSECKKYKLYLIAHQAEKKDLELKREALNMDLDIVRRYRHERRVQH